MSLLVQKKTPLFPDVIWSRPENKNGAGKLLMIGGSSDSMAKLASSYAEVQSAGIGNLTLLAPNSIEAVTRHIPEIEYAPSTPSGSFARQSLDSFLSISQNNDAVFLAGDMGKNSETSLLLESFLKSYPGLLFISSDCLRSFEIKISEIFKRERTTLFLELKQMQALGKELSLTKAITSDIGQNQLYEILRAITELYPATIVFIKSDVWVVNNGRVAVCKKVDYSEGKSVVWGTQQPEKQFEALASSVL